MTASHPSPLPSGERVGGRGVLNLGDWNLFEIWSLEFGASICSTHLFFMTKIF